MTTLKPYPAYADTDLPWLPKIPTHWEVKPLKRVSVCLDGKRIPLNSEQRGEMQGEYPYWGANSIVDYIDKWLFDEELVLLGEDGAPFFDKTKEVAFFVSGKAWVNNHAHVLRPKNIEPKFLAYALNTVDYLNFIDGSTRDKLTQGKMNDIPVQCPPLPEQRTIAAYLDRQTAKIDALIAKKQRLLDLLAEQRAALISQAVAKGLNPNVEMKDSGVAWLGQVPSHWRVKRLKYVGKIQSGLTLGQKYEGLPTIARPYLRVANVQDGYLDLNDVAEINLPIEKASQYRLENGDVLMTEGGDFDKLGRGYVWEGQIEGCLHQNHIFAVRPDSKQLDSYFLSALLTSSHGKNYFTSTSQQTTNLATTNATKLKAFPILLPPIQEQKEILAYIDKQTRWLIQLENKVTAAIEHLQEYRAALISSVVTGKIDVRNGD